MMITSTFEQPKSASGLSARLRGLRRVLRRMGAAYMQGMREQRQRDAARVIAHGRYLASLDSAARFDADARPKIVSLRRSPATQPMQDSGAV